MVRQDGYSLRKILHHTFSRARTEKLAPSSHWNFLTTLMICLTVTPALMFYPQFFAWVGVDFTLQDLDVGLRWVGLVVMQITFMGFTLSLHDHEYVSMGTMIHRPVELGLLAIIYAMGEIHFAFFVFMFMGVPLPAGICLWLWRKETSVGSMGEYWKVLAHPGKDRTILGKWIETLGWIVLAFGATVLVEPAWLLEILGISQAPLVVGYVRVAGWAWMIVGWCYFMNARHEHCAFFDIVLVQNTLGIMVCALIWSLGWFPTALLILVASKNMLVILTCVAAAFVQSSKT
jgi:hypothetical protein